MKKGTRLLPLISVVVFMLVSAHTSSGQDYVIGGEDVLRISVWGNPELSVEIPVRPDGMISVPLLEDVKAAGLTPQELKKTLEGEYVKFVKAPVVSVIVVAINSFKVYVLGEGVTGAKAGGGATSGIFTLRRNTTLMQLLAQLGSLREADLNSAYVLRDGKRLSNDFFKLIINGDVSQDLQLSPNDMIVIPDNFEKRIRVVGAVKTPVILQYREGMTALDAVLNAGGFTEFASQNSVLVVRKKGAEFKNIEVRLKDVMNGDISKNLLLEPGDIVTVKTGVF